MVDKGTLTLVITILATLGTAIGVTLDRELERHRLREGVLREIRRQEAIKNRSQSQPIGGENNGDGER